jgi:hypothetical protein
MADPRDYEVVAHNTATTSANKIHDDDVARAYGFGGGLVPGVDVYAYMTHPPAEGWGLAWLERGTLAARFVSPAYEDDVLTVAVGDVVEGPDGTRTVSLEVRKPDGTVCAVGEAGLPPEAGADAVPDHAGRADWPAATPPDPGRPRPPASPESLPPGRGLALAPHAFHAAKAGEYLDDVREGLPLYREAAVAHPAWLVRGANSVLGSNVALGPWIHVESVTRHLGLVTDGMVVEARARVVDEWERKGHRFVRLDVGLFGDGQLVVRIDHTAIHTPRKVAR